MVIYVEHHIMIIKEMRTNKMTMNQTIEIMKQLKLSAMAKAFENQANNPQVFSELSFEERLSLLMEAESLSRKNNLLQRLIRQANFNQSCAAIENIQYLEERKLNREFLIKLATNQYVKHTQNIILVGASGAGKTYISCALGMSACRSYIKTKYMRLPDLLVELQLAREHGTFKKVIEQYKKITLLILDEWLLIQLKETEARDILEIIEARHNRASTIFCSQFDVGGWHEKIGESTLADAILDRIVHNSHKIIIDSKESMRKLQNDTLK